MKVREVLDDMTEEQQLAAYSLIGIFMGEDLEHGLNFDDVDDCLKHYGVLGMKWGKRKARRIESTISRKKKKDVKLNVKASLLNDKALSIDAKNSKKLYKLQKKELKAEILGNEEKLRDIRLQIKKVNVKSAKIRYKVAGIKDKINKNENMIQVLEHELDVTISKHASKYKKEIERLMKDQVSNQAKISRMERERNR